MKFSCDSFDLFIYHWLFLESIYEYQNSYSRYIRDINTSFSLITISIKFCNKVVDKDLFYVMFVVERSSNMYNIFVVVQLQAYRFITHVNCNHPSDTFPVNEIQYKSPVGHNLRITAVFSKYHFYLKPAELFWWYIVIIFTNMLYIFYKLLLMLLFQD